MKIATQAQAGMVCRWDSGSEGGGRGELIVSTWFTHMLRSATHTLSPDQWLLQNMGPQSSPHRSVLQRL